MVIPGTETVGLLGGGVIGGGWAARFLLNGYDVRMFDPDPEAARKVSEVMANARRALSKLVMTPLPAEGTLTFVATPEEAATGVIFVQESAPERLELKQELLARASRAAGPEVVFGSSTSGLLPTEMQRDMTHPERLVVGHPFNPVYLMPLVEICGGAATSEATKARAAEIYRTLGMRPLMLGKEIDGFVADRLMEALWREALWLINDGVATATEIDDAIRYGPGLRWSFMGTMLVYRIAGGEAGMRHFMAQFGPALKWPWTKLMDVPELTDELLDTIVSQSDDQAAGQGIRQLEALRDDCLVAVMQSLRTVNGGLGYAAGTVVADYDRLLFSRAAPSAPTSGGLVDASNPAPIRTLDRVVPTEWIDYNGHVNDSRYFQMASQGTDAFMALVGVDADYLARGNTYMTVETHMTNVGQAHAGDPLFVEVQLIGHDAKRMNVFAWVRRDGSRDLVATVEFMLIHASTVENRALPASDQIVAKLASVAAVHDLLPAPARAARRIGDTPVRGND